MNGWLLDTNILSELSRRQPASTVIAWMMERPEASMFISVLTLGEIEKGLAGLAANDPRRVRYERSARQIERRFVGRVLPVTESIAKKWGLAVGSSVLTHGAAPPAIDMLLAATALDHNLVFVTRNIKDVSRSGVALFNPFDPQRDD